MSVRNNAYVPEMATIEKIERETNDVNTYTLTFKDKAKQKDYSFAGGQFNMLSIFGFGEAPISISSDPQDRNEIQHTVRKVGGVTEALFNLKEGEVLGMRGPYGRGWPLKEAKGKNILVVAGGIGLAPLRPVITQVIKNREEYDRFELLYGARTPGDMLFTDEFDHWQKVKNFRLLFSVDAVPKDQRWDHNVGVVTTLFDQMSSTPSRTIVMTCGPEIMMKFALKALLARGFNSSQIFLSLERRMECGLKKCGHCQIGEKYVCSDGPVFPWAEIKDIPEIVGWK
ncbi:MAG TPA: FAD/NAD(P)-binding protein [Candidatus Bathyarchaeia archaeon]|nr:MAG: Ni/Fe hydrogenase subunit gamma [Candidatus Bathyarchaeota archaeon RBG_16_48_13]HJX22835.1 FAD/NAD(P)-binding protein [Candidatus Bathyarchaeia archaeon]